MTPGERDEMVRANLGLVHFALKHIGSTPNNRDDLLQVGCLGLIHAVDRFDPDRGVRLSSYATRCIRGYMMGYLTNRSSVVRVPERVVLATPRLRKEEAALTQRLGRHPSVDELASAAGVPVADVHASRARTALSLDSLATTAPRSTDDRLGACDDLGSVELASSLDSASLTKTERFVADSLAAGMSQADVARALGVAPSTVSRLVRERLRDKLAFLLAA